MSDDSTPSPPTGTRQPDAGEWVQGELDLRRTAKNAAQGRPKSDLFITFPKRPVPLTPEQTIIRFDQYAPSAAAVETLAVRPPAGEAAGNAPPMTESLAVPVATDAPAAAVAAKPAPQAATVSAYGKCKSVATDFGRFGVKAVAKMGLVIEWGLKRGNDVVELVIRLVTGALIPLIKTLQDILAGACAAALMLVVCSLLEAPASLAQEAVPTAAVNEASSRVQVPDWVAKTSPETKIMSVAAGLLAFLFRRRIALFLKKSNGEDAPKGRPSTTDEAP